MNYFLKDILKYSTIYSLSSDVGHLKDRTLRNEGEGEQGHWNQVVLSMLRVSMLRSKTSVSRKPEHLHGLQRLQCELTCPIPVLPKCEHRKDLHLVILSFVTTKFGKYISMNFQALIK